MTLSTLRIDPDILLEILNATLLCFVATDLLVHGPKQSSRLLGALICWGIVFSLGKKSLLFLLHSLLDWVDATISFCLLSFCLLLFFLWQRKLVSTHWTPRLICLLLSGASILTIVCARRVFPALAVKIVVCAIGFVTCLHLDITLYHKIPISAKQFTMGLIEAFRYGLLAIPVLAVGMSTFCLVVITCLEKLGLNLESAIPDRIVYLLIVYTPFYVIYWKAKKVIFSKPILGYH
jgi:hypothetical protein